MNDSIWAALILLLPSRVGFLAVVALWYVMQTARSAPVTLRPGDRYFPSSVVVLGTLVTLGIWSYRAVAGGP